MKKTNTASTVAFICRQQKIHSSAMCHKTKENDFTPNPTFEVTAATTTAVAAVAEEFPQTSSPHSHHAQGSNIPFGTKPSLRYKGW